ncbi:phosphatidylinositol 3 protein [Rutstroemia sp. NJR-2017a WRK4]|nr:phosphatidylinositol 3 protein [Rutstroemia sp. NJR-2017a WRK4]
MAPQNQPPGTPVSRVPPSTMAAQLINNLSIKRPSRQIEHDELQTLMNEVSMQENDISSLTDDKDIVSHKHKLVYVITRVVWERLEKKDIFTDLTTVIDQACEALDVFISTIEDIPEVLNFSSPNDLSLTARGPEPLWLWLFPRILSFLGRGAYDKLTQKISTFFITAFEAVSKSPRLWKLTSSFFSYIVDSYLFVSTYRATAQLLLAILGHLHSSNLASHVQEIHFVLPSDHFDLSTYCDDQQGSFEQSSPCNYMLRDVTDALRHATYILTILVNISNQAATTQDASLTFQNHLAWILDSFQLSHDLQRIWPIHDTSQPDGIAPGTALYCATQSLISSIRATIPDTLICKSYVYLAIIGADILDDPSILADKDVNLRFCHMLLHLALICRKHNSVGQVTGLCLVPKLQAMLGNQDTVAMVGKDFENAASALEWACGPATTGTVLPPSKFYRNFEEESLNVDFGRMLIVKHPPGTDHTIFAPPSKRRKLSINGILDEVTKNLYLLLGNQEATDLGGLSQRAVTCFTSLDESGRAQAIKYLSMIPCAAYGSLVVTRDPAGNITHSRCFFCEKLPIPEVRTVHNVRCQLTSKEAISILTTLVKSPIFHDSKRSRVLAMIALRTFATHYTDNEFLDLEASSLGQWCLQSLQSSVRELRIAAGRALPEFLEGAEVPQSLLQKNRTNVLIILRDLCEKPALYLQETCVLAWGQLGRLLEDGELNIVLLKLVEYLGHTNPIVSNAAYNEILKLAKSNGTFDKPVERMFTPFWESVAIAAVKDLLVRPQTTQLMADLLEMTVPDFLILTQAYTLPWLVLWGEVKIIKKIAQARNEDPGRVCIDDANVFRIMALLLVQDVNDIESHTMSKLKCISPEFDKQGLTFAHLLKIGPPNTFLQLLIVAGDADGSKKSRIYHALKFLVEGVQSADNTRKGQSPMAAFMEQHNLGLITRISEVVNDSRDEQNTYEKKRHVRAVEEMIKIAKTYTRSARPQICACLQSALAQKPLQASAFSAWAAMLRSLDDEDVEIMLESTFSTIIQCWDSFDELTKNAAEGILEYLVAERGRPIRNKIVDLPSLSQFPQLADIESKLQKFRSPTDVSNTFQIFSRRIRHENAGVVAQALSELKVFLQSHQAYLQASAVSEQPDVVVGRLVRSILDACVKFNESHHDIADLTGACIGLIGCLDPNRVEAVREQREMVVVANFEDPNETTDFVLFILEEVVVNAFLSATDTNLQGFLSYVMQELLERGGFKDVCVPILRSNKRTSSDPLYQKWISLPEDVQATLTPFLTSKFSVTEMKVPPTRYPIFQPDNAAADRSNKYNNWLKAFVLDLLQRPKNVNAELIFAPLRRAVRIKDLSVASFLLPYLVLHVVIKGEEAEWLMIKEELYGVLSYSYLHSQSRIKYEELRLCSEANYLSRWIQAKQLASTKLRGQDQAEAEDQIRKVTTLLESIPAKVVSNRAIQCRSYARALFYWEQHIRHAREKETDELQETRDMERLQEIYTQIDEPDGIEGISAHLHVLDIDQIILGHRKAGRWTAAQSWYEIKLADDPGNVDVQLNLLTCLKASGQHGK